MKQLHTVRLFWKQYAYKVVLEDKINKANVATHWMSARSLRRWFFDKNISNKLVWDTDWSTFYKGLDTRSNVRIYLKTAKDYEAVLNAFAQYIVEASKPFHESHIDLMKANASMRIQPKLLYGKFRYAVIFRQYLNVAEAEELTAWVKNSLNFENTQAVKWALNPWGTGYNNAQWCSPRLYLRDESDLILIRLAWEEKIKQILVILLQHEVDGNNLEIP